MEDKKFKYQDIISELNIDCPYKSCYSDKIAGFRWAYEPVKHEDNFLPNIILDKKYNRPRRRNSLNDDLCSLCGLSLFISEESAKKRFNQFPKRIQLLLGYTHIAAGTIEKEDGLITNANEYGHFELFEYEGIELVSKFYIIGELNND